MCFYFRQTKEALEVANRFKVKKSEVFQSTPNREYNGFSHPLCETITTRAPDSITPLSWGLIPGESSNNYIRSKTLNARIETLEKTMSFKNYINDRCLVISDGFYEWKHIIKPGGVIKERYLITTPEENLFSFAGICSWWRDSANGSITGTFAIITTAANNIMSEIHNTNKRMPVILSPKDENYWLEGADYKEFALPYSVDLIARPSPNFTENKKRGDLMNLLF